MPYLFLLRLGLSLVLALLVVLRLRAPLRGLIIRLMPLKVRMSEKAFDRQARLSNIIGFSAWTILAAALYLASAPLAGLLANAAPAEREPAEQPARPEQQSLPPAPIPEPAPSPPQEPRADAPPAAKEEKLPEARTSPESYGPDASQPIYLQLGAYRELAHARASRRRYEQRLSRRPRIGHQPGSHAPYKVLLGPFPDRSAVVTYRSRYRLPGYPRQLTGVRLYQE